MHNGADVLDELRDLFAHYLALAPGAADVMALWVAHTFIFDRFDHTGYLAIVSPQRRSGKSTTLAVLVPPTFNVPRARYSRRKVRTTVGLPGQVYESHRSSSPNWVGKCARTAGEGQVSNV